jgi:hypothetical protein
LKSFIVEMLVFIEMAGSRNARPRILRLSLTKPQRSRGQLENVREPVISKSISFTRKVRSATSLNVV